MQKIKEINEIIIRNAMEHISSGRYSIEHVNCFSKAIDNMLDICKLEGYEKSSYHYDTSDMNDNIIHMGKHFINYWVYKKEYQKTGSAVDKEKCLDELTSVMGSMKTMLEDMKLSSDEKEMIGKHLKEMYEIYK